MKLILVPKKSWSAFLTTTITMGSLLISLAGPIACVFATDGIAVSMRSDSSTYWDYRITKPLCCTDWPTFGKIFKYTIVNDKVTSATPLDPESKNAISTTNQFCGRYPTLNINATKCAYFREVVGSNGGGGFMAKTSYLTIINIDGSNRRDLVDLTAQGGNGMGYMDWPKGDWIYYNLGGNNTENSRYIWRVNEKTGVKELVVTLAFKTWVWSLSANGDKMTVRKADSSKCANEILRFNFPADASKSCSDTSMSFSQGCTNAISASGNTIFLTMDAGHSSYVFSPYQKLSTTTIMTAPLYNAWAVNCAAIKMSCADDQTYTVGDGCEENRFSANSDKWACFRIGWQQGGRWDDNCGSNQVLVNWQDKKTIMVSFNPRSCTTPDLTSFCPNAVFTSLYKSKQDAGDFVVTGPDSEINADLRQYLAVKNPILSFDEGSFSVTKLILQGKTVILQFSSNKEHTINLYNVEGQKVLQRRGIGVQEILDISILGKGLFAAQITENGKFVCKQFLRL